LGAVLVEQGLVTNDDIEDALAVQVDTSQPLGEILLQRSLIARPTLAKALAAQRGRSLEEERGFGSGLMARIEHLHLMRRGLQAEKHRYKAQEAPPEETCEPGMYEPAEDPLVALLQQREAELDERERELAKQSAQLARLERKLKRQAANSVKAS
jgi:flagellar motility protein MotE (MotC chaperone)